MKHLFPNMFRLRNAAIFGAIALVASGCATSRKINPEMSEQMRQMAEWRDTCTQYAAWIGRDFQTNAAVMKETQRLYIAASASANSYIEQIQFDLISGGNITATNYAKSAELVRFHTTTFLEHAQKTTGVTPSLPGPKSRGFVLLLPAMMGLVDLGSKLNAAVKNADRAQRELVGKAVAEKKWKPINELMR